MLIQPPWNDFKALWNLGKDSLTKPMPRKFCGVNQDAELGSTHISVVWQGSCAHQQLVLLRNSEIPAPVTGYTVGSTDSSVSGKSFLVRAPGTLSQTPKFSCFPSHFAALLLCPLLVLFPQAALSLTLKFRVIKSALCKPVEDAGTASSGLWPQKCSGLPESPPAE